MPPICINHHASRAAPPDDQYTPKILIPPGATHHALLSDQRRINLKALRPTHSSITINVGSNDFYSITKIGDSLSV